MSEERNFETEARSEGWLPKEEFAEKFGSDEKWVDAEQFVKRGEEILPIVNAKNRKLQAKLSEMEQRIDQLMQSNAEFKQFTDKSLQKERKEKQTLIAELEKLRAKAVAEGDGATFEQVDRQLTEARAIPDPQGQKPPEISPEIKGWMADNDWYGKDKTLTALVDGFSGQLVAEKPWLRGKDHLEACKAMAMEEMPERFGNPKRKDSKVEEPGSKRSGKKGRSFDDLPDDAKSEFKKFQRDIPGLTEADYLSNYEWES